MNTGTSDEFGSIGAAEELQLASLRRDGTLRPYVTMWDVRAGDDLHVHSVYGPNNPWFRPTKASGAGRGSLREVAPTTRSEAKGEDA